MSQAPFELVDGPVRVKCWPSEEDGGWIARVVDEADPMATTLTASGFGTTMPAALAHLALALYAIALSDEVIPPPLVAKPAVPEDPWIAGEEARLRRRHQDSGSTRPYYSGD